MSDCLIIHIYSIDVTASQAHILLAGANVFIKMDLKPSRCNKSAHLIIGSKSLFEIGFQTGIFHNFTCIQSFVLCY